MRPDIVMYGESLDQGVIEAAVSAIARASLLIVAGTSLVVYPAAGLINYFSGDHLVLMNATPTSADAHALAPRKGQPIRFHAVAEEYEGFGADDEAQLFVLVQDALGVLDAGIGGGPCLAHKPCE